MCTASSFSSGSIGFQRSVCLGNAKLAGQRLRPAQSLIAHRNQLHVRHRRQALGVPVGNVARAHQRHAALAIYARLPLGPSLQGRCSVSAPAPVYVASFICSSTCIR